MVKLLAFRSVTMILARPQLARPCHVDRCSRANFRYSGRFRAGFPRCRSGSLCERMTPFTLRWLHRITVSQGVHEVPIDHLVH